MRLITVSQTTSTNAALKTLHSQSRFTEPVCFRAEYQSDGRGQRDAKWQANPLENLTFSILFPDINIEINDQFKLNMLVALKMYEFLKMQKVTKLFLKWPNDIMAENKKIGGILIENTILKHKINDVIIGIGFNINQTEFSNLPKATSLKKITNVHYDLENLLKQLLTFIEPLPQLIRELSFEEVRLSYESQLFKKDMISVFTNTFGVHLNGIIRGVDTDGKLQVETEDETKTYGIKEIELKY